VSSTKLSENATTTSQGWGVNVLRGVWVVVALCTLLSAVGSFLSLAQQDSLVVLFRGGVFSVDPQIAGSLEVLGLDRNTLLRIDLAFRTVSFGVFAITAILIFVRKSNDWMTGLASIMLLAAGTAWFAPLDALESGSWLDIVAEVIGHAPVFSSDLLLSIAGVTLVLFLLLFPNARFVPHWASFVAAGVGALLVSGAIFPESILDPGQWPGRQGAGFLLLVVGGGVAAQGYRYLNTSDLVQRQQTKLVVAALVAIWVVPVFLFVLNPGLGAGLSNLTLVTPRVEAVYDLVLLVLLAAALLLLPISIGISVLRYRLWDVDVFINRTMVYGALTAILGTAYFGIVAAVGAVMNQTYFTIAAATLSVALVFQPLRRRLQDIIDKQFYRSRYNASKKVEEFAARLRREIDLETMANELLGVIDQTIHPTGASLWVPRDNDTETRPDSSSLRRIAFWVPRGPQSIRGQDFDEVILDEQALSLLRQPATGPIDIEAESEGSAALEAFKTARVKFSVPLVSQGELVGMINLGPRTSESDYSIEDIRLLHSLAGHAAGAVRVALLVRERDADLRAKQLIENEMRVAQLIQQQFLPKELPRVEGWAVHVHYKPARDVGGDFYDFIPLSDGRLMIVAGDVTGKGVPAALVMATTRSLLRGEAERMKGPAAILQRANKQLVDDIPGSMFVTCQCLLLDPGTGLVTFANAGHNLPYLRHEGSVLELRATGMPLGLMPDITYEEVEATLRPGDNVIFHSDGLAEARREGGEMFGFPRMKTALQQTCEADAVIGVLLSELESFVGPGVEQEDDVTLVVLHRLTRVIPRETLDPVG
jgi:serine phosphatase RsbU (regulator of sigma subunit)